MATSNGVYGTSPEAVVPQRTTIDIYHHDRRIYSRLRPASQLARQHTERLGIYDGNPPSAGGFNDPRATRSNTAFGGGSGGDGSGEQRALRVRRPPRCLADRSALGGLGDSVEETVLVTLMPEKEGMFMFQHHNYEVTSSRREGKVIRRYSDFVWLLDCMHKRYPFRTLPLLPPEEVAGMCVRC